MHELRLHIPIFALIFTQNQAGRHGHQGGMRYICMNIYTEGKIQVLTTKVTDDKCINSVALLSQV